MNRVYLSSADRAENVRAALATAESVKASMKEGTYMGGDYGSKTTRLGPKFVDSVNGVVVPTVRRKPCLTTVTMSGRPMEFACPITSFGPITPFSHMTHKTAIGWVAVMVSRWVAEVRSARNAA